MTLDGEGALLKPLLFNLMRPLKTIENSMVDNDMLIKSHKSYSDS